MPDGRRFKKHGSSKPVGATIEAFNCFKSLSVISPGKVTSEQEPTEIWLRLRPSPVTLEKNGEPLMCLSPKRTETLYSPGAVGR